MSKKIVTVKNVSGKASGVTVVITCVMVLIFMGIMVYGSYMQDKRRAALEARCTAPVEAVVSKIDSEQKTETRHVRRNGRSRTVRRHYTQYTYYIDYSVGKKTYRTTEVGRDTMIYTQGEKLNIKYDPDDPAVCYVRRANDGKAFKNSLIAAGITGGVILIVLLCLAVCKGKERKHNKNVAGQTFEEWQAEQQARQRQQEFFNSNGVSMIDDVDKSFTSSADGGYMKNDDLNSTSGFMDSI